MNKDFAHNKFSCVCEIKRNMDFDLSLDNQKIYLHIKYSILI